MISPSKVSVVLISYARPWNLPKICESLLGYGFEDIHLADNWQPSWESDGTPCRTDRSLLSTQFKEETKSRIKLIKSWANVRTASRYLSLDENVKNSAIATVDDDYIVTHEGWDRLLSRWDGDNIIAQLPEANNQFSQSQRVPFINIGYGSLFPRDWAWSTFTYLRKHGRITESEFYTFADRIFTTFCGSWDTVKADDRTLVRLKNHDGKFSDVDRSSIHLRDGYWLNQWKLVMKVMLARKEAREMYLNRDPSLSEYRNQMGFLSRTACGDLAEENGCS